MENIDAATLKSQIKNCEYDLLSPQLQGNSAVEGKLAALKARLAAIEEGEE